MITDRLKGVILSQLKLANFPLESATTANQVPGWDSLSHVGIISAVEKEYSVRFKTLEVIRLKSVGDLQKLVDRYTAS